MTSIRRANSPSIIPLRFAMLVLLPAVAAFLWAALPTGIAAEARVQNASTTSADGGTSDGGDLTTQNWGGADMSMLFRDDELFFASLDIHGQAKKSALKGTAVLNTFYPANDALTSFTSKMILSDTPIATDTNTPLWGSRNLAAAGGRIADPLIDDVVLAWYKTDGSLNVELRPTAVGSNFTTLHTVSLNGTTTLQRSVNVAVGDLDLAVDDNDYYHDEVVVARTANTLGSPVNVQVDVLDYNFNTLASTSIQGPLGTAAVSGATSVSCAMGDFDGDHAYELAVAEYWLDSLTWQVNVYRLVQDETTLIYSLKPISNVQTKLSGNGRYNVPNPIDIAAGDFANSGKAQIAVVMGNVPVTSSIDAVHFWLYELDLSNVLQKKSEYAINHLTADSYPSFHLRAVPGVFKYDPDNGWDVGRRQLAVSWDESITETQSMADFISRVNLQVLTVGTDYAFGVINSTPVHVPHLIYNDGASYDDAYAMDLFLTAGNFIGHGVNQDQTWPVMQIALVFTEMLDNTRTSLADYQLVRVYQPLSDFTSLKFVYSSDIPEGTNPGIPVVVAADYDGDTWLLGDPLTLTITQYPQLDTVIQEPPKHVEYLPAKAGDLTGEWSVEDNSIGAYSEFKVSMVDKDDKDLNTTTKSHTSYDIAGAVKGDYQKCFSMHKSCEKKSSWSLGLDFAVSGNYEHSSKTVDTTYSEYTLSYTTNAALDDTIIGKYQMANVWRYPIIGYMSASPDNLEAFYETIIPGSTVKFSGGGFSFSDWYQPTHENHNVLSYPQLNLGGQKNSWVPEDLGSFTIPDPDQPDDPDATKTITAVMNWPDGQMTTWAWDGNPMTIELDFSQVAGVDTTKTHQTAMSESLDIKFGRHAVKRKGRAETDFGGSISFDAKNTWGGSSVGETKETKSNGITIERPAGEYPEKGWMFTSAVYMAQDGTLKVAHATDPKGSTDGADWWGKQYGKKTDPALNLPYRFEYHLPSGDHLEEWWTMRELDDEYRKRMRGFFMKYSTPDEVTGQYNILDASPTDGDVVQLCARVYNYSFVESSAFKARFYYLPWNTTSEEPSGQLQTQTAMTADVAKLDGTITAGGTNMREICVPWDTTGLSTAATAYRFVVRLDEENIVNELHESWDSAGNEVEGGNNEGFWPWHDGVIVASKQVTTQGLGSGTVPFASITLPNDAIAIKIKDKLLSSGTIRPVAGKPHPVRVRFTSDRDERRFRIAVLYDQDPDKEGAVAIASRVIHGFRAGDNHRWIDWTPKKLGDHDLYVRFLDPLGDASKTVGGTIHVNVTDGEGSVSCHCSSLDLSEPPDSGTSAGLIVLAVLGAALVVARRRKG